VGLSSLKSPSLSRESSNLGSFGMIADLLTKAFLFFDESSSFELEDD